MEISPCHWNSFSEPLPSDCKVYTHRPTDCRLIRHGPRRKQHVQQFLFLFLSVYVEVEVTLRLTVSQSVSLLWYRASTFVRLATTYYLLSECCCLKFAAWYLLGGLSDERTGLQFAVAAETFLLSRCLVTYEYRYTDRFFFVISHFICNL
jgi:hypothetical protein